MTVLLALIVEGGSLAVRDPELAGQIERAQMLQAQNPARPLALWLGSSRIVQGGDARALDGLPLADGPAVGVNGGLTAAGPIRQLAAWRRYRDAGVLPGLVIIEIMPPLLNAPQPGVLSEAEWLPVRRFTWCDLSRVQRFLPDPARERGQWLRERLTVAHASRRLLLAEWAPEWTRAPRAVSADERGWQPLTPMMVSGQRAVLEQRLVEQYASAYAHFVPGAGPQAAVYELVAQCQYAGAWVVPVLSPESSTLRQMTPATMQRLLAELGQGLETVGTLPMVDAREWVRDDGFYDGCHLLPAAATDFSTRLADTLRATVATAARRPGVGSRGPVRRW